MDWLTSIRRAIAYMEATLTEDISAQDVAAEVNMSPFFLQRGFSLMTGYGIGEYIRNRRLYRAALDLENTADRVIDIAFRYCYETPESFAKAFARFHGATPSEVRSGKQPRPFLPIKISISVLGGSVMDCTIVHKESFTVIGYEKDFSEEDSYTEIPRFWNKMQDALGGPFGIGEFGICIDGASNGRFRYMIAGLCPGDMCKVNAGKLPCGITSYELPAGDWAVFDCVGSLPAALQNVNTRIYKEWLPGNPDWELSGNASVEWYGEGDMSAPDYHSAIWIPVKPRQDAPVVRPDGAKA
ncbi:MAG: AraC family transcriptional regulator [Treponema sp.]|nr:AraC family transcriptional regulator [Treponema sp.]